MSRERIRRAEKIVSLRLRAVDAARARLAEAMEHAQRTEIQARAAEKIWEAHARWMQQPHVQTVQDLRDAHAHLRLLRQRSDTATRDWEHAQDTELERRRELADARLILKKFESWRDRLVSAQQDEDRRLQARFEDELAARVVRSAS